MHTKLYNVTAYAICIQNRTKNTYDLPHPIAQPSLHLPVYFRSKALKILGPIRIHGKPFLLV